MSEKIFVVGIDYSMTCPAVCTFYGSKWTFENCNIGYMISTQKFLKDSHDNIFWSMLPDFSKESDQHRYDYLSRNILEWTSHSHNATPHYFIEGYSFGSKGKRENIAENCGLLKHKLYEDGHRFTVVPPTTVKKFAVGKGNSKKTPLYEQFYKETGVNLVELLNGSPEKSPISDIVDSYFICKYGFEQIKNQSNQ